MKIRKLYSVLLLTAMLSIAVFSFPKHSFACGMFDINCKVNNWAENEIEHSEEAGMKWIRAEILLPDSTYVANSTTKWLLITRVAGWSLFGIMFISRLGVNLGHPFVSGRLNFDDSLNGSFWLMSLGSCLMIYDGQQFISMARDTASSFTSYFGAVDFTWPVMATDFEKEGYQLLGLIFLAILVLLWIILYALYLFRDMMLNFIITATPLVGATIVYTDKFFRLWWQFALTFILMKPIHAWAISYSMDYLADASTGIDPFGKILISICFFGIILILPFIIMGNSVRTTIKMIREGGL